MLDGGGTLYDNIAYESIQRRRAQRRVRNGLTLHDYVPFMFAPRSPMLFTINNGNVEGCNLKQDEIVHLFAHAQNVADSKLEFEFSNYHAVMDYAQFFNSLDQLSEIDWELILEGPALGGYCRYWNNRPLERYMKRKETRQAEFLVRDKFPISLIRGIGVASQAIAQEVENSMKSCGWNVPVVARPQWYY